MKIKKVLYFLLIIGLILAIFAFVILNDYSIYYAIATVLSIFLIFLIINLIKRYLRRRKNKKYIKQVMSEDKDLFKNEEKYIDKDNLEQLFMYGINNLQNSFLKKDYKEPIYAYPWVMFLGEENSGKTEFLKNSNLTTSLTDMELNQEKRAMNWWFFEDLVALDFSGKFTNMASNQKIEDSWETILEMLAKYRKKEPLNGIVITISVESLLSKSTELISNQGLFIRKRINQIMKIVGASFPIYIMVTKMDRLLGFNELVNEIPEDILGNSFGYINENFEVTSNDLFERELEEILNRLNSKIREVVSHSVVEETKNKDILQVQSEFTIISQRITVFIKAIFRKNQYQYIPTFRGLYFSSSLNDEKINSNFYDTYLQNCGITQKKYYKAFVDKFINKNLIEDRYLFNYLEEEKKWIKFLKSFWVISSIILFILSVIYTYFSYSKNMDIINKTHIVNTSIESGQKLEDDIESYYEYYDSLKLLEKEFNGNITTHIGFTQAKQSFDNLKVNFINQFENKIFNEINYRFKSLFDSQKRLASGELFDDLIAYLVLNISYLDESSNGKTVKFSNDYRENSEKVLPYLRLNSNDKIYKYLVMYEQYLNWSYNKESLKLKSDESKDLLSNTLNDKQRGLKWIINSNIVGINSITIDEFAPLENLKKLDEINKLNFIKGIFTKDGYKSLLTYVDRLKKSTKEEDIKNFEDSEKLFIEYYETRYIEAWKKFIFNFDSTIKDYSKDNIGDNMLFLYMVSKDNPYVKLIKKAAIELEDFKKNNISWIDDILVLNEYLLLSKTKNSQEDPETMIEGIKKKLMESGSKFDATYNYKLNSVFLLASYFDSLSKMSSIDSNISSELQNYFSFNKRESYVENAYQQFNKFKFKVSSEIKNEFILNFISNPIEYVLDYAIKKESCNLNDLWIRDILYNIEDGKEEEIIKLFNNNNGNVPRFIEKYLDSYVTIGTNSYTPKILNNGVNIPFKDDFIRFINRGMSYNKVTKNENNDFEFKTIPVTSIGGDLKPQSSSITIDCFNGAFNLDNSNYKDSKRFRWNKEECKKLTLKVSFQEFDIYKIYEGEMSFVHFMEEYKSNGGNFDARSFYDSHDNVNRFGIRTVNPGFIINGDSSNFSSILKPKVFTFPQEIAKCLR